MQLGEFLRGLNMSAEANIKIYCECSILKPEVSPIMSSKEDPSFQYYCKANNEIIKAEVSDNGSIEIYVKGTELESDEVPKHLINIETV